MRIQVDVPLSLTLFPPTLIRQVAGGVAPEQVPALFPAVSARLVALGQLAVATWQERITRVPGRTGRPLRLGTGPADPMVQLNRTTYATSVRLAPAAWEADALTVTVSSDSAQAEPIEAGTPGGAMDLHQVLPTAPKARRSRAGTLYLRIPFRHATVSADSGPVLPKAVVHAMRPKATYLTLGTYQEPSVTRPEESVTRYLYAPRPGRLTQEDMQAINARAARAAAQRGYLYAPPVLGAEAMQRWAGLMRTGARGHGGYLTIRTLSQANRAGWRVPPYPPQHLLQGVAEAVSQAAADWFDAAIRADIEGWVRAMGGASA